MLAQLVIACFNEGHRLPDRNFIDWMQVHHDTRFLFVDDGSTDTTAERLQEVQRICPSACDILSLARNYGKAEAIRLGMLKALVSKPDFLGYWDADCATPLDELPRFIKCFMKFPSIVLVMGVRVKMLGAHIIRKEYRHYAGRVFATCASLAMGLPAYDTQCGAKLFRVTPWLQSIFENPMVSPWLVDIELLFRLDATLSAWGGASLAGAVHELPLGAWHDVSPSKVKLVDFFISLAHLVNLRMRYGKCRDDTSWDAL
jgi:glycosyltransferase involved in cell wall biosynthesis